MLKPKNKRELAIWRKQEKEKVSMVALAFETYTEKIASEYLFCPNCNQFTLFFKENNGLLKCLSCGTSKEEI